MSTTQIWPYFVLLTKEAEKKSDNVNGKEILSVRNPSLEMPVFTSHRL